MNDQVDCSGLGEFTHTREDMKAETATSSDWCKAASELNVSQR